MYNWDFRKQGVETMNSEKGNIPQGFLVDCGYVGQYVATPSFNDNNVVAHGNDAGSVITEAKRLGYETPFVMFLPDRNIYYYYNCLIQ